jgi:alcohol dehydrogenase
MKLAASYTFANPTRIHFGAGKVAEMAGLVRESRICLVTSAGFTRRGLTARLQGMFGERLAHIVDTIDPNPDLDYLDRIILEIRALGPDAILGIGGGSAMDSAKVIAKAATAPQGWSLAQHFRKGAALHAGAPLPCYVMPTTSGTGAEVTPFATVWDGTTDTKYSLAGPDMFPTAAVLDPELTLDMPREVTLSTGLDAVSQAIESVWNKSCNHITFAWAVRSLRLSLHALPRVAEAPGDLAARSDMAQASLLAGLCISHTRTALAHSISYPLTAHHEFPHGFACSFTLPALFDFNSAADDGRLAALAQALGGADAAALRDRVAALLRMAEMESYFRKYVRDPANVFKHVREMITPNRADNNMRSVDYSDIEQILRDTFGKYVMV